MSDKRQTPSWMPSRAAAAAVLLGATALSGFAALNAFAATPETAVTAAPAGITQRAVPDFADLVSRVKPAVVSITTHMAPRMASDEGMQTPFGMPRQGRSRPSEARGSGFIVDADGTVVTNNHVVKDAKTVSVTLDDGTELSAKVIGRDARTDIAVLKITADHKLPFIELGNSSSVRPGEWVLAMGNPYGLGGTVTAGIVSARGRQIGSGPYDDYIQIDAPINPGNSGGPLFNQDGRVVGINTAIFSPSGGSVGIGFAVPADMVRTVVAELKSTGTVTRGYLGVESQPVTADMAKALRLPKADAATAGRGQGALVASVQPDSPAAKAGLQPGDVIRSVDGKPVVDPRDLAVDVAAIKPGSDAKLDIVRDGGTKTITVAVATLGGDTASGKAATADRREGLGVSLAPLSAEARAQLELGDDVKGVVVADVKPGSPAEQAGITEGDVILGVGAKAVTSPKQAAEAIRAEMKDGKSVALRILRDGHSAFVAVDVAKGTDRSTDDQG